MSINIDHLVTVFEALGENARVEIDHGDGCYDIAVDVPGTDITDCFHVYDEDGRLVWADFSHTTDLGPVDGSEAVARIEKFAAERGVSL